MIPRTQRPFRNKMNRLLTKELFYELTLADKTNVVYTLKDWDHEGYPSLYRLYLEEEDLTEYSFATKHLDSFSHWESIANADWFKDHVLRWRKELELRVKSKALRRVIEASETPGRDSLAASKFILSYGHPGSSKGRPTKEDIRKVAEEEFSISKQVQNDFQRLIGSDGQVYKN